ncbi:MAG TPA: tetratricopeptide repeat protein [Candidatus Fermentibacter daniensis]|nr:tetratricopeptide repeat protein [Candidatus Fermentibacter daniensis]OQC68674.1 MAG: cellulose synthase subunit BcsC [candidate division Hyd24-12 bacterium ADurb.Bin004]HOA05248.1 tetratricopeptide repeat protein [Candidatus Fermentibacter daniensis]HOR06995.1 tetratricopeptide repeat protein [Candidatus Fermentibacter daniensis]HPK51224.1 tetratricopeptide repeat protein [Candidatus Fermentibacter daniensis]
MFLDRRFAVIASVVTVLALSACSTPAVTGVKVHIQNGEYLEAIALADSVLAGGESQNAELWLWRGKAQGNIRDWTGASESFEKVSELAPAMSSELTDYWFVFYNAAAVSIDAGDIDAGVDYLQTGRRVVPSRPEYDQMLGDLALQNGDYETALEYFRASSDLSRNLIASLEEDLNSAPAAEKPAIEEALDSAEMNYLLSLYNTGTISKALAVSADTDEAAQAYLAGAASSLQEALAIDPTNADVLNLLAQIYLLRGSFDEAMAVFDDALAGVDSGLAEGWLSPEDAQSIRGEIMLTRGAALLEMERYDEAVTELEAARQISGSSYVLLGNLAQAYIMKEEYNSALAVLDETDRLPDLTSVERANSLYMQFAALNQLERDAEAAAKLEAALAIIPDNADWWEYLASTYSRLNRRTDAIRAMERAQQLRSE